MKYPNGSNSLALKLMQDGSETIHAESNEVSVEMNYRKKADVAEGIMLHVGGFYLRYGKPEIAASEGCFGITDGSNNNSNYYTNHVLQSIINQSQKSIDHKGRIDVVIDKRNGDEFKKFKTLIFDK